MPEDKNEKERLLLSLISEYEKEFKNLLEGKSVLSSKSELVGGARIAYIFNTVLPRMFDTIQISNLVTEEEICTLVKNSSGINQGMFLSQSAFE